MAEVSDQLSQLDRPGFRKHYDIAWSDIVETNRSIGLNAKLVIERPAGLEAISATDTLSTVFVKDSDSTELAKLLTDTGGMVLATSSEVDTSAVINSINAGTRFQARAVVEGDVRLLVDALSFESSPGDRLLTDILPWLSEALVIGHESGARNLEKGVNIASALERLRRIRLRECNTVELSTRGDVRKPLERYFYRDDQKPTLIIRGHFAAVQLADSAKVITEFVNSNLRTFELLLVRLESRFSPGLEFTHQKPTAEDYAYAAGVDIDVVKDLLAAQRHDDSSRADIALVILAYLVGAAAAQEIYAKILSASSVRWPEILSDHVPTTMLGTMLKLLDETTDLAIFRRDLGLDYAKFNQTLTDLQRSPLSSEAELRRRFELWKDDLRESLNDRLRRHYAGKYAADDAIAEYASRRSLEFVTFDETWIYTHETIDRTDVRARAETIFTTLFGADPGGDIAPLESLRIANRKVMSQFAQRATPVLKAAAGSKLSKVWLEGPSEIANIADRAGLLDFNPITDADALDISVRAGLWPVGIERTLDLKALGLTKDDLDAEKRRMEEAKAEEARRRNTIEFASRDFDASGPNFAEIFAELAHEIFAASDWRARSSLRPVTLAEMPERETSSGGGGITRQPSKVPKKPPEAIRSAMGLAGELLAFRYLQARHGERFSDRCWISENRTSLFPEMGDFAAGFDFKVNTTETEWLYEVKATTGDLCEFELTDNEYRTAVTASPDRGKRYRILFVQHVFDPTRCRILELPNPAALANKTRFSVIGSSSVRMRFNPN